MPLVWGVTEAEPGDSAAPVSWGVTEADAGDPGNPTAPAQRRRIVRRAPEMLIDDCLEIRVLDSTEYWFWDGYFGVTELTDIETERIGRLALDPNVCFRVALSGLDDIGIRTRGYRLAVAELLKWVNDDRGDPLASSNSAVAKEQLKELTGLEHGTDDEWVAWWTANRDFVWWSEDQERLEIDEDAKRAGIPLHDEVQVLSAEEYWFYEGRGWLTRVREIGDYVRGSVLMPPQLYNFQALAADLENRVAKQTGYVRAVQNLIFDGMLMPELQGVSLESIVARLTELTGEEFEEREAWVEWWELNHERLQLSADGNSLVVQQD